MTACSYGDEEDLVGRESGDTEERGPRAGAMALSRGGEEAQCGGRGSGLGRRRGRHVPCNRREVGSVDSVCRQVDGYGGGNC